ncbi:MAG: neutral/alkaline non-lysosomal ceramidase N-terminal domain-containing protein, partial [Actinomycetota bacterium]
TAMYLTGPTGDSDVRGVGEENLYAEGESKALRLTEPTLELFDELEPSGDFVIDSAAERVAPPEDHQVPNFPLLAGAPIPFLVSHRMHIQAVRIGDLLLGGVPGEPVMALGKDLKDEVKALGLQQPFMLSHANDWTGYIFTPEQYDAQQGRSNQGAYGRNQGVFIVGRLVNLVKGMLGRTDIEPAPSYGPLQLVDDPYYSTVTNLLNTSGPATGTVRDLAVVPNIVLSCEGLAEPSDISRFEETRFTWRGGNNAVDTPSVELQLQVGEDWETVATDDGYELQTWLDIYKMRPADPYLPGTTPGCNELVDQKWSAAFEPAYDFPTGTYRLRATGLFRTGPGEDEAYESVSEPFTVGSAELEILDVRNEDGLVSFTVAYPRDPSQWRYRPRFASTGTGEVLVDGSPVATATFDPITGRFKASGVGTGEISIRFTDGFGNTAAY